MEIYKTILIFILLALVYTTLDFVRIEFYQRVKFKTKEFVTDPSKLSNVISLVLAAISIGITFSDTTSITNSLGKFVVPIVVIFLIIIILILFWMSNKNDRILSLERQLESETKGLWKEYGQLNKYKKDNSLFKLMEVFVKRHSFISSVQRYRYSIFEKDEKTVISLHGLNHYINEGFDLNTVSQAYFEFSKIHLQELVEAFVKASISKRTRNKSHDDYTAMIYFFLKYAKEIKDKDRNPEDYSDSDALLFCLVEIAYNALVNKYGDFKMPIEEEIKKKLQRKKSGLMIAIALLQNKLGLLDDKEIIIKNYYKGDSDNKKKRHYSNVEVENELGEQYVFVLSHTGDKLWSDEEMVEQFKGDVYNFVKLIEKQAYLIK